LGTVAAFMNELMPDASAGHLLGGRVRYAQSRRGFRSGIEPVLLAAAVPAKPGQRVLEGGSGAGAALLCLAARVAVRGIGIERDAASVALARRNAADNDRSELSFIEGDVTASVDGEFDHAFANPPYHLASGTPSPDPSRELAKRGDEGMLAVWASALARSLGQRGTLTFILASAALPAGIAAFAAAGCAPSAMLPLWPKEGRAAKLVLLRGVKGGVSPFRVLPGLVLHAPDGGFTPAAEAILRDSRALPM
jgi:tRNA1Val (adenine37-N6)-methyltransferase